MLGGTIRNRIRNRITIWIRICWLTTGRWRHWMVATEPESDIEQALQSKWCPESSIAVSSRIRKWKQNKMCPVKVKVKVKMCPAGKICIVQRRNAVQLSQDPISSSGCRNPQPPILSQLIPTYANSMSLKDKTSQQWQHNLSLSYVKTFALWREMFFILFSSFVFCVLVQRKYWQLFSNWLLLNGWLRSLFSALQGLTVKPGAATTKKSV